MTGNETGIMLMNYILSCRKHNGTLPERPVAVKTIVTSEMIPRICADYGCELRDVLTGFSISENRFWGWKGPERPTGSYSVLRKATAIWPAPMSGIRTPW